ncbi:hypothetical protein GGC64_003202 [Mycobacterium sp. OAS707]|uniref:hypothetical protein n=1 Tax=unclassified Mycobacterium TaxID=2642494 RepID=UPI001789F3D7|nr:hypothetical protein [Mycobacterium sp. OAS707]MBE1549178.1 hypothetical protein [Mycobacterium sp. OAS707]
MVMHADQPIETDPDGGYDAPSSADVRKTVLFGRPGLRFGEVMSGMITMGCTEPSKGYQDDAAIAMRLEVTVDVPNLPAFLRDPSHRGRWSAAGSIPVLGGDIEGTGVGDFRLFQRAIRNEKGVREMVYDSIISVGDQTFCMRGRKYMEPSPPWRLWPATTTLHVQLFPLAGERGQAVGAGILRLTLRDFVRQLLSMRITGKVRWYDKLRHLFSFYRFFVSSLVNTYLKGRRW